ncbi:MAG TPA: glycosyl transferase [Lachnospiraceae bacterium]|jgi:membrane peptidoglycan carboxypeptidase|nr:glycosyl transferase [Lachnospiraceae bacterium]HCR40503.1 glycosyl transferase [Lachnospiraceae bacterium]
MRKDSRKQSYKRERRSVGQAVRFALRIVFLIFLLIIVIGIFYFYHTYGKDLLQLQSQARQLVSESTAETFRAAQTSLVYDSEGDLISALKTEKDVYYINFEDIPEEAIDAMLVSEDRKFLEHGGIDYLANFRAAMALVKNKGKITQGASTITQQLARNVFLTHEVTYERKTEEIFIARELEKKYSKFDILEFYFNNIYFANGHYGIQAASFGYFGESITGLSLSEVVFLCAIPNNPNRYNPVTHFENTIARRDRILKQMLEDQMIGQQEYEQAVREKIQLKQSKLDKKNYVETYVYHSAIKALMAKQGFEFQYSFANEESKQRYEEAYNELYYTIQQSLFRAGYRIYTSIDMKKQEQLQKSVDEALKGFTEVNEEGIYKLQGAAVCIDNDNGRVVAVVGGREQKVQGYTLNRAYQSYRQPGSAIKPLIVYTPSFERGYTPDSIVVDEKFEGGPSNAGRYYAGEMKLQRAIELSKNTVAWKLFEELTPSVGLSYLLQMNFAKIHANDYYPAASLGGFTIGVSPVEMAAAFSTLENDGAYREPTCIVKIMDSEGNEVIGDEVQEKQVYQKRAARIMTESLTGVIKNGTAKGLGLKNTVSAGKTGTTDDRKDGWFVGYTPYYTTSVWVGYDLPKTVKNLSGSSYPAAIWHDFMNQIHTRGMNRTFEFDDWRSETAKTPPDSQAGN